jgi:dephospho-CoA kinase
LGEIIFGNKEHRKFLTSMTGKYIFLEILKEIYKKCIKEKHQIVLLDAPLLFES